MTKLKIVSLFLALSALTLPARGQSLELKVGRADSAGTVRMLLVQGEASLQVEVQIGPMSAQEKATALAQAVFFEEHPGPGFFDDAVLHAHVQKTAFPGNALPEDHVELDARSDQSRCIEFRQPRDPGLAGRPAWRRWACAWSGR